MQQFANDNGLDLESSIAAHVGAVRSKQSRLGELLAAKRQALVTGQHAELARIASDESSLTAEFVELESKRQAILISGRRHGVHATSLGDLARELGLAGDVQHGIAEVRETAEQLQREAWTQLIVAVRAKNHYDELIGLIASGGQGQESYDDTHCTYEAGGGNLLDAAA